MALITNLYSALAQGTLWGIMALGVYITFRILDIADLSCDGTFALGGCISAILITRGVNPFVTLLFALVGGMFSRTCYRLAAHETYDPCDLSRYFNNDRIMVR